MGGPCEFHRRSQWASSAKHGMGGEGVIISEPSTIFLALCFFQRRISIVEKLAYGIAVLQRSDLRYPLFVRGEAVAASA